MLLLLLLLLLLAIGDDDDDDDDDDHEEEEENADTEEDAGGSSTPLRQRNTFPAAAVTLEASTALYKPSLSVRSVRPSAKCTTTITLR